MAASTSLNREQRVERARAAGKAAQSPDTAAKKVIANWPEISPELKAEIARLYQDGR